MKTNTNEKPLFKSGDKLAFTKIKEKYARVITFSHIAGKDPENRTIFTDSDGEFHRLYGYTKVNNVSLIQKGKELVIELSNLR
ncbi:hypothetical protein bcgnr5378_36560 [Bacillus cereus]|uniref:hypothetical protein n=1 Tax=Bacillus cereus TaxID=1396 RepID=UPI0007AB2E43|nr:hypothetical protein [Bacillus cereus]